MFEYIARQASISGPDSLISSFNDFGIWSRYSGPRRGEWCQTTKTKYKRVEEGTVDEAQAITGNDVSYYDGMGKVINPDRETFVHVAYAQVIWRFQKNRNNGKAIKYYKDTENRQWCPCRALWNITQRAKRLKIPSHEPLAKYRD